VARTCGSSSGTPQAPKTIRPALEFHGGRNLVNVHDERDLPNRRRRRPADHDAADFFHEGAEKQHYGPGRILSSTAAAHHRRTDRSRRVGGHASTAPRLRGAKPWAIDGVAVVARLPRIDGAVARTGRTFLFGTTGRTRRRSSPADHRQAGGRDELEVPASACRFANRPRFTSTILNRHSLSVWLTSVFGMPGREVRPPLPGRSR